MGLITWIGAGMLVVLLARLVPKHRRRLPMELIAAALTTILAGGIATALDFGGWREVDPRALAFVASCSATAVALLRITSRQT